MAKRKKKAKAKRTKKKVMQAKADKPSMTDQLKEARKRYTVSKSSKGSNRHTTATTSPRYWLGVVPRTCVRQQSILLN